LGSLYVIEVSFFLRTVLS